MSSRWDWQKGRGISRTLAVCALAFPGYVLAQLLSTNNTYSAMVEHNSLLQSNLTNQMINLGGAPTSGSGQPVCLPPTDLQRGPAGLVPPQFQADPRYQQYLHCRYGNVPITPEMANAPALPVSPAAGTTPSTVTSRSSTSSPRTPAHHRPLSVTDFVPAQVGHPAVDQQLASMSLPDADRTQLLNRFNVTLDHFSKKYRGNNLSVSICVAYLTALYMVNGTHWETPRTKEFILTVSDAIAQGPTFAQMSDVQKQNIADTWMLETTILNMLNTSGKAGDPQAAQQATQLARVMVRRIESM